MKKQFFEDHEIIRLAQLLKVVGEANRLLLLEKIIGGVQCNCELGDALKLAPNLISHHLAILKDAGLITAERDPSDGRWVYYSINLEAFEELHSMLTTFLDIDRVQPRRLSCGPQGFDALKPNILVQIK